MNCTRSEAARTVEQFRTGSRRSTRFRTIRWAGGNLRQRPPRPQEYSAQLTRVESRILAQPRVVRRYTLLTSAATRFRSNQMNHLRPPRRHPFLTTLFDHHWFPLNCQERTAMSSSSSRKHAGTGAASDQPAVPEPSFAERARTLVDLTRIGSLSTLSRKQPGFPFGSVMPYGLDDQGRPIFLISTMAMHTQNLQADPRASLLVTQDDA